MANSTWTRDVQLMEAVRVFEGEQPDDRTRDRLVDDTRLSKDEVNDGLRGLLEAGYVAGRDGGTMDELHDWWDLRLLEPGRQTVGQWPSNDPGESLIQLLEERIAHASDAVERSRFETVLDTVRDVGTGVLRGVLTDLLRGSVVL